jgi:periplasmic protein TonB
MNRSEGLARWLIQRAARTAPSSLSERLEEEWLADLEVRRGSIERLRLAVGCCWATRVIAHEHCAAAVAAAGTATGSKTMSAYMQHDETYFSRRSIALLLIIALHVVVVWALASGLGRSVLKNLTNEMTVVPVVDRTLPKDPPPLPVAKVSFTPRKIDIAPSEVPVDVPPDPGLTLVVTPPVPADPGPPVTMARSVKRVGGGPGKGFPNTEDYYPAAAIRQGLEGAAIVHSCVDAKGRLTGAPTMLQSSGISSLDEGALRLAKAGSGHYRPTTEDGQAVSSCFDFRVTFHMLSH